MTSEITWEDHYKNATERLPWDIGTPAPELQEAFAELDMAGKPVLEIGCGTGTNAIWMAQQKCNVVATDISPTAIEQAKEKAVSAKVEVKFSVADIIEAPAVQPGSVDFVFDRGVFHVMTEENRFRFADRVAESLKAGGFWLTLAGSKDEVRENPEQGPPQLSAVEVITPMENKFEIHRLERSCFELPNGNKHVAWIVLVKKRSI
ncbi:MAG: class I SAM-dependent methyltransferase [Cyanobacteria bacterium PR.3.49]|nr:class I SAM-dependent methyltransferase [Cyanobacteria bacterium PR.3.49]